MGEDGLYGKRPHVKEIYLADSREDADAVILKSKKVLKKTVFKVIAYFIIFAIVGSLSRWEGVFVWIAYLALFISVLEFLMIFVYYKDDREIKKVYKQRFETN